MLAQNLVQSGVYVMGARSDECADNQPVGIVVVYNARRNHVRVYRRTERNEERIFNAALGLRALGTVGQDFLPDLLDYALLPTTTGVAVCNCGTWGFVALTDIGRSGVANDWYVAARCGLMADKFTKLIADCVLTFVPDYDDCLPQSDAATCKSSMIRAEFARVYPNIAPSAVIEWRNGVRGYRWYLTIPKQYSWEAYVIEFVYDDTLGFVPATRREFPTPLPADVADYAALCSVNWQPTPRQAGEMTAQLEYWRNARNDALGGNDWARIDDCNCYVWAIEGILAL